MQAKLFAMALGIEEPLFIDKIEFDNGIGELNIYINFKRGAKFECSVCGKNGCSVHDTTAKTWRHLNFFQYKCYIHLRTPSTKCDDCGVHLFVPKWGRAQSGFTMLFEAFVLTLAREMGMSKIAEIVGETDKRLFRIVSAHVKKAYGEKDLSNVVEVGIDETSTKKGHKYISVFVDMQKKDVVYVTEGKNAQTIEKFAEELPKHGGDCEKIKEVSMDMSPAFISGSGKFLPNANVTFDKFHVVKLLNEAVDQVRREEQKINPLLKGSRYIWLKNPANLTSKQTNDLKSLSKENKKLSRAYQIKLTFQDIYREIKDVETADIALKKWRSWAKRSRLEPIKIFEKTVAKHYDGILNYFKSRLTAGISEGINSRIQELKRRAKGYKNINNFITMIYLDCANLALPAF